jgi:2-keto-3-deoxy-L-rhamnonate aldolase RhmA
MVIVVIEEAHAVENIATIAAIPEIDVLFIGTSDLAFSLGVRGNQEHPRVREAVDRIVEAAKAHGKVLGAPASDWGKIQRYMEQGFLFFQARTELGFMAEGAKQLLDAVGKGIQGNGPRPLY